MPAFGQELLAWTELILVMVLRGTFTFNVTIISLLPYSIDVGVSLRWTGPALLTAVEDTNRLFEPCHHAVLDQIYDKSHQNCTKAREEIPRMLAEFYYRKKLEGSCAAIIGANCVDMSTVSDLAREWDVMAFAIGPVPDEVVKSDIAFLMGGSIVGMAGATLGVMDHYGWRHATVLLDASSFTDFYSQYARSFAKSQMKRATVISIIPMKSITDAILTESLKAARSQSRGSVSQTTGYCIIHGAVQVFEVFERVIIISALASTALQILKFANQLNMTNGNYAFINFQSTLMEPYGKLSLFSDPNSVDLPAFQSLIFMTSRQNEVDARRSTSLNKRLRLMSQTLYNSSFDDDLEPLDSIVVRGTYDSIDFFMRQLNGSNISQGTCSAQEMSANVANRTFALRTGTSYIDEDGVRELDSLVYRFSTSTRSMQSVGFFDSSARTLWWNLSETADWPGGVPPIDMPRCGFQDSSETCALISRSWADDLKVALPVVLLFVISLMLAMAWYRHSYSHGKHEKRVWFLDSTLLSSYRSKGSSMRTTLSVSLIALMRKEYNFS